MKHLFFLIVILWFFNVCSAQYFQLDFDSLKRNITAKQLKKKTITTEKIMLVYGIYNFENESIDTVLKSHFIEFDSLNFSYSLNKTHQFFMTENEVFFTALLLSHGHKEEQEIATIFKNSFLRNAVYPRALLMKKIDYDFKKVDVLDLYLFSEDELKEIERIKFKGKNFLNRIAYQLFLKVQ